MICRVSLVPLLAIGLSACVMTADPPAPSGTAEAEGVAILHQPVRVGPLTATPLAVAEDSRCPMNARCVWAGRVVVTTRIEGAGWRETVDLMLGTPRNIRSYTIELKDVQPPRVTQRETKPVEYRFAYTLR